jgi:hypothetical protein
MSEPTDPIDSKEFYELMQPYRHVYQRREDPNFDIVWDGT